MPSSDAHTADTSVPSPALAAAPIAAAIEAPLPVIGVAGRSVRVLVAASAILGMAAVSAVLAATSDHVEHPTATAMYYAWIVAASLFTGLYWSLRRPGSRFGRLLGVFGLSVWAVSWQSADWSLAFDVAVLADGLAFVLTIWLFLAFPSGRLGTLTNQLLIGALIAAVAAFFIPWALLSPLIAGGGPLAGCRPACPANVLQIGSSPSTAEVLGRWETYALMVLTVAVLAVYWRRVMTASRPQRRALLAVAGTSLLFLPIFLTYHFSRQILEADPSTLQPMAWTLIGIRVILPLGFLVALLQAEVFAGAARGRLLEELVRRPSPRQWRDAVALALDDAPARIAYWDPETERHREPDGSDLEAPGRGRSTVEVRRTGQPVAALVLDDALAEDPELVRAASSATLLAVENGNLEGQLLESETRLREVGASERKRIERDLHDGAQQRLVALRINLEETANRLQGREHLELERFGLELDHALDEVRAAAAGDDWPRLERGVATALESLARTGTTRVTVADRGFGRRSRRVEETVYFCCAEALQNVTKHAGHGASVAARLWSDDDRVGFAVEDDGVGFEPRVVARGRGLENMAERVAAAGGALSVGSELGRGTRVEGWIPANG
jgi:signal transduction histidine kinase